MAELPYFDHASTSLPKDPRVIEEMVRAMGPAGATPGRGGHAAARRSSELVARAREDCARLMGNVDADGVVFTLNATDALNVAIKGVLRPGDHVVTTQVEHNSVSRPLRELQRRAGLRISVAPCDAAGRVDAAAVLTRVVDRTRLVVMSHASNVTGALQPVAEVGRSLRLRPRAPMLLADVAQTAGYRPLDEVAAVVDAMAMAGHKGPGGPLGTGVLWRRPGLELRSSREGGTGIDSEDPFQPRRAPEDLEAGSPNLPGIAGLGAAVRLRLEAGLDTIREARRRFTERLLAGLDELPFVRHFGPRSPEAREAVFPFRARGFGVEELATLLELEGEVQSRSGLHCAPGVHRAMGTAPEGCVRWSFGPAPSEGELLHALDTLRRIDEGAAESQRGAGRAPESGGAKTMEGEE